MSRLWRWTMIALLQAALAGTLAASAEAGGKCRGCGRCRQPLVGRTNAVYAAGQYQPWHGNYYDTAWGAPVALVVPPTAEVQTDYRWGVPSMRLSRIYPQFQRAYGGPVPPGGVGPFLPTPHWPSDTNQFGDYYVRGPW